MEGVGPTDGHTDRHDAVFKVVCLKCRNID